VGGEVISECEVEV